MNKQTKIYVAGHRGLVGSAIWKNLTEKGYTNLVGQTHTELDLLDAVAVRRFFDDERPECVILAAAHVGGILANNQYRADFIYQNLQIQQNVIGESFRHGVQKLVFLGSTCIYPREAEQPMKEDALLTSPLEYTNEPYAIAKIAGLKLCESFNLQYGTNYIAVMPTNLYGPNDNFDLQTSHVLPAMLRKIHLAKCMQEGDWEAVRKDLRARPVPGAEENKTEPLKTPQPVFPTSEKKKPILPLPRKETPEPKQPEVQKKQSSTPAAPAAEQQKPSNAPVPQAAQEKQVNRAPIPMAIPESLR